MNKKIYFDKRFILITEQQVQPADYQLIVNTGAENEKLVEESVKNFIQQTGKNNLILLSNNVKDTFDLLKKQFVYIRAAGGLIKKGDRYLFILRMGKWDLPKGKLDGGESLEEAAVRECEEECGVKELKIVKELPSTCHIYPYKGKHALKESFWFSMETDFNGELKPQTEEDIEKAVWLSQEEIQNTVLSNTYSTISDVIKIIS